MGLVALGWAAAQASPHGGPAAAPAVATTAVQLVPAGPNKVAFPQDWVKTKMYATVDRPDTKQYREFYTTPEVLEAARAGKPIPDGAVIVLAAYMAQLDANGVPLKDVNGRFMKGSLAAVNVQQKKKGFGDDIPASIRNGDWQYQLKVSPGQTVTWTNADDTPHQITLVGGDARRSEVMLKGQRATLQFDAVGNIAYTCGLHPTMKGTIKVVARQ